MAECSGEHVHMRLRKHRLHMEHVSVVSSHTNVPKHLNVEKMFTNHRAWNCAGWGGPYEILGVIKNDDGFPQQNGYGSEKHVRFFN